ncbi:MAG: hypothetical protein R3A44_40585 [Caldilineaceae bacterium]
MHIELLKELRQVLPEGADVVLLGDGGIRQRGTPKLSPGCRLGLCVSDGQKHHDFTLMTSGGAWMKSELWRCCLPFYDVAFTQQAYGPVLAIAWWRSDCADPLYLVTNLPLLEEACRFYRKRMKIETFFSDQKSRGFELH